MKYNISKIHRIYTDSHGSKRVNNGVRRLAMRAHAVKPGRDASA